MRHVHGVVYTKKYNASFAMTCSQTPPCKRARAPVGLIHASNIAFIPRMRNCPHANIFSPKLVKKSIVHAKFIIEQRVVIDANINIYMYKYT